MFRINLRFQIYIFFQQFFNKILFFLQTFLQYLTLIGWPIIFAPHFFHKKTLQFFNLPFFQILQIPKNIQHLVRTIILNTIRPYILNILFLLKIFQFILHKQLMFFLINFFFLAQSRNCIRL